MVEGRAIPHGGEETGGAEVGMVEDGSVAMKSIMKHSEQRGSKQQRVRMVWSGELHTRWVAHSFSGKGT
jgi:hypothetical protein